jgi:lipopolysaccharide biosynthesis glycosyltransferase
LPVMKNECSYDEYFNSGVISMNLEAIRKHGNMKEEIIHYLICHGDSDLPDQDALNVVYKGQIKFIDQKYNYFVRTVRNDHELELKNRIYHYVGTRCFLSHLNDVDIEYYKTVARSPWGQKNADIILRRSICRTVDRVNSYEKILDVITSSEKIYIFVGNDWVTRTTMEIIHKRKQDVQVLGMNDLKKVVNSYREKKVEFVVFVTARFNDCIEQLENMGLVNEKDFFIMQRFMSDLKGGYI